MIFRFNLNFIRLKNILFFLFLSFLIGCESRDSGSITAVASTTHIGVILNSVGGDHIDTSTILPGGICPGHFDLKPSDMKSFSGADIIFYQGWEPWIRGLINSEQVRVSRKVNIPAEGNLMLPPVHISAVGEIVEVLKEKDPENAEAYETAAAEYINDIQKTAGEILKQTEEFSKRKVVSSLHQKDFLRWLGLEVVYTYKRADEMSPGEWQRVISKAKEEKVSAVIDNLQSGPYDGKIISEEVGISRISISNFPLENSYILTLKNNFSKIKETLKESEVNLK